MPSIHSPLDSIDILSRLKQITNTGYFSRSDKVLVNSLKEINPTELKKVLERFFTDMIQEDCIADPAKFLDRLVTIIPFEKLQEAVKDDIEDAFNEAKGMFEEAKLYLQLSDGDSSLNLRAYFSTILDGIISTLESIILVFGIGDFFKPAESEIDASMKSNKIMTLLHLFGIITPMILPALGAANAGLLIGGILVCISALSAIWPFIKPKTNHLPANAENWTKQVQKGSFVAQGRKESLDAIATILKTNRHAILVGPSRVGKSLTAKAFAQSIERGDYPELRGKVIFRINTTDIADQKASFLGGGNDILNKISAVMGRHRNDIILVLDEIHMACKNNAKISDQLKTFLDEEGEFPHVIGITTEEEYKHVKDNHAFSLRFDRVNIENTSQDETLKILSNALLKSRSKPLIKENMLNLIYEKTSQNKEIPQPAASLNLLKRCINRAEKTQQSPTEKKIIEISSKIQAIRSQTVLSFGKKSIKDEVAILEKQLSALKETLHKEHIELNNLFKSKDLLNRVTRQTYFSIIKIATIAQKTLQNEKNLKSFLLGELFSRSLESHIEKKAKDLGLRAIIDENLINEVVSA